jgi:hypothetical protein
MALRVRSFWIVLASVAYAAFAALRASDGHPWRWAVVATLPLGLAWAYSLTARDEEAAGAVQAARVSIAGAGVVLATSLGPPTLELVGLRNLGVALASVASLVALARLPGPGGLLEPAPTAQRLDAAAIATLQWTVAVALPLAGVVGFGSPEDSALLVDSATVVASVGSLGLGLAAAARVRLARRLEIGVAERASAAFAWSGAALAIAISAVALDALAPERVLPLAALAASLGMTWAALAREADAVARALRALLAIVLLEGPVALAAAAAGRAAPEHAPAIALGAVVAATLAATAIPALARRVAPEPARWLAAFEGATRAAMTPDPDVALETALFELRAAIERGGARSDGGEEGARWVGAAVYRLSPPELVLVDRAGYVRVEPASVPPRLVELAATEPWSILRAPVLRALLVRRPEVRVLLRWLDERSLGLVAVVRDDAGPIGLLALPRRARSPLASDEARAIRRLADRIGALLGVSASLAGARAREATARADAERASGEAARAAALVARDARHLEEAARRIERPARRAAWSPAARFAVERLESLAADDRPLTLLAPPGVDGAAWAALAHLASPRRAGPLVILHGTSPLEHDLIGWRDPLATPFGLAAAGTLVLLDPQALPHDVQRFLGAALPAAVRLIVVVPATAGALVAAGRLEESLADRLGDRAVPIPPLASRAEDLRALALDQLAALGASLRGRPIGIDDRALAVLAEHTFPGNEAELASILLCAALACSGDLITHRDLEAAGLPRSAPASAPEPQVATPAGRARRR